MARLTDRQKEIETRTANAYGQALAQQFLSGKETVTFEVDIFAWQAALSWVTPADCVVSVRQSNIDHCAYTVTLRVDDSTKQRWAL